MVKKSGYELCYAPSSLEHLAAISPKYHSLIRKTMLEQLEFEPAIETRNRKRLHQPAPFEAQWELRFGPDNRFRVLYNVDEAEHAVGILAIGEKDRNRLLIGGEEMST